KVGNDAVRRWSEVTLPLSTGTLRSWRISTRLPDRSRSVMRWMVMVAAVSRLRSLETPIVPGPAAVRQIGSGLIQVTRGPAARRTMESHGRVVPLDPAAAPVLRDRLRRGGGLRGPGDRVPAPPGRRRPDAAYRGADRGAGAALHADGGGVAVPERLRPVRYPLPRPGLHGHAVRLAAGDQGDTGVRRARRFHGVRPRVAARHHGSLSFPAHA